MTHFFNHLHDGGEMNARQTNPKGRLRGGYSLGRHVNAESRKSLEIQAYSITKPRTLLKRKFV